MVLRERASWRLTLWRHMSLLKAPTLRGARYIWRSVKWECIRRETKPVSTSVAGADYWSRHLRI